MAARSVPGINFREPLLQNVDLEKQADPKAFTRSRACYDGNQQATELKPGDRVKALPGKSYRGDGIDYYKEGDVGSVVKVSEDGGTRKYAVRWDTSGKTTTIGAKLWADRFDCIEIAQAAPVKKEIPQRKQTLSLTRLDVKWLEGERCNIKRLEYKTICCVRKKRKVWSPATIVQVLEGDMVQVVWHDEYAGDSGTEFSFSELRKAKPPAKKKFETQLELAARTALLSTLFGLIVIVPSLYDQASADSTLSAYTALIPGGTVLMVIFTVYENFGSTVQLFYRGFMGTLWACIWAHVMNAIMPKGAAGDHYYAAGAHAANIGFIFLSMWLNLSKSVRMFIISYHVYFAMDFMNPDSTTEYNTSWAIDWKSSQAATLITATLGLTAACFVPLIPYPIMAKRTARLRAKTSVYHLSECMDSLCDYFRGDRPSVVIEAKGKHTQGMRRKIEIMAGASDAMWWETFDFGSSGVLRELLKKHIDMMRSQIDILSAMQVCLLKEDFRGNHNLCMERIGDAVGTVCSRTRTLLFNSLENSAEKSSLTDGEKDQLGEHCEDVLAAIQDLSVKFNQARQELGGTKVISKDLQSESFFVFCVCAYARHSVEYALLIMKGVQKPSVFTEIWEAFKSTFEPSLLYDRLQINQAPMRGTVSILLCYYVGMYWSGYNAVASGTVALLISEYAGSALQKNMGRIQAVVLGATVPHLLFDMIGSGCGTEIFVLKAIVLFLFEWLAMYIYYSSTLYGYIGCLVGAFSCSVLIYPCGSPGMTDEEYKLASFRKMAQVVMGVIIMSVVDIVLAPERASTSASKFLLQALMKLDTWFQAMFIARLPSSKADPKKDDFRCRADIMDDRKTAKAVVKHFPGKTAGAAVSEVLALAQTLGNEASYEPRYSRSPWPTLFFDKQVESCCALKNHLAVIEQVLMGMATRDKKSYSSFVELRNTDEWKLMKNDVTDTFGQALQMTQTILHNETGKHKDLLANRVEALEDADTIEGMSKFFKLVNALGRQYPKDSEITTMEDDDICRLNVILMLFEESVSHIADMMKGCLSHT